jgi:PAS domain S-box-containing protein
MTSEEERRRDLFENQLEASVDGILCVSHDGGILWHNQRFAEMWGLPKNTLLGYSAQELTKALTKLLVDPDGYLAKIQTLYDHQEQVSRDEVFLKDGRVFDRYSAPVTDARAAARGRVWFFRDITQRKRTEEELRAANERLQELNDMKNQFVNTAAHELATPVMPIALQVHLLLQGKMGPLTDTQRDALELVNRNLNRLNTLMKEIVPADVPADRVTLRHAPLQLQTTIAAVAQPYTAAAAKAGLGLTVETQPDLAVRGDEARLAQTLRNLLDNAIKFTPKGGQITLTARREGDEVLVHVQDTGIGLRPGDYRRIFQPFSQVHDTMQHTQAGRGLGLVTAQGIVELHGGRMWCDSAGPGKGSTFSFSLPYAKEEKAPIVSAVPRDAKKQGVWPFIHFRCPVCESRDINMRIIKNKYECGACKHEWR